MCLKRCTHVWVHERAERHEPVSADGVHDNAKRQQDKCDEASKTHNENKIERRRTRACVARKKSVAIISKVKAQRSANGASWEAATWTALVAW